MRKTLAAAILVLALLPLPARPQAVEPVPVPLPADAMGVTVHRLPNGLTVYLSPYSQLPRVTAWIATRAGSRQDPADSTGMAHYLEHMLFKGSSRMGALDFAKEKPLLDRISALYEKLFATRDPAERKAIYQEIDRYNVKASTYSVPNELDQVYRRLGVQGLNAFTSNERTVFICDLPANRLEAWARVESDRFAQPVFRLFQTELETVYEEKNRSLDNADRILDERLERALWKNHPYGRTVLGSIEHLKNPSLAKMYAFHDKEYVPGNMAIALSGDFDRAEALKLIERTFGSWRPQPLPADAPAPIVRPAGVERVEVKYEAEEKVYVAWQTVPYGHPDRDALRVLDMLMDNSVAGIINLDLVQAQKVKAAGSYADFMNEAGAWVLWALPKKDQKLEEAETLLMAAVAKLKAGQFTDEDIKAVVTNFEVGEKYRLESNEGRAAFMTESFLHREPWPVAAADLDRLRRVTKERVLAAARKYLGEDRIVAYRRQGKPELPSIAKPEFTKLDIKPGHESRFAKEILGLPAPAIEPRWLAAGRDYTVTPLPEGRLYTAANPVNDLFSLTWRFNLGLRQQRRLCAALELAELSGAGELSAEEFKKKLFALGTSLGTGCSEQEASVGLSGLEQNLWPSLQLMLEHFRDPNIDPDTLRLMAEVDIGAHRDNKKDPGYIHHALSELAQRGRDSGVLLQLADRELLELKEPDLRRLMAGLWDYKRRIAYVGAREPGELARLMDEGRKSYREPPPRRLLRYLRPVRDRILFTHRDMLQSRVGMFGADEVLDPAHAVDYQFLAEYLGGDMSSVIFQEVREARALAYSAGGGYASAAQRGDENMLWGSLGTQADKTLEAALLLRGLLKSPPLSQQRFAQTAKGIEEYYRANPIGFRSVPASVLAWEDQGLAADPRPERFAAARKYTLGDLEAFSRRFADRPMTIYVLGNRDRVDLAGLRGLGDFEAKSVDELFPY
ncbi:MAG: insulinase family protein [Elusimicrobia bacterium]|nr:insulinase family protein [Elusimicrobiota bacterium]